MDRLEELKQRIDKFNKDRDWDQFHSPVNLAKSISIEANELLECYQWNDNANLDDVKEYVNGKIPMALIGCKEDLFFDEQIKSGEGENFAKENDLIFFETSAKEDINVIECFNEMISRVVENNQDKIYNGMKIKKVRLPKKGCLK